MKLNTFSGVDLTHIQAVAGVIPISISNDVAAVEDQLKYFTTEELAAELLRRTSLGKELE